MLSLKSTKNKKTNKTKIINTSVKNINNDIQIVLKSDDKYIFLNNSLEFLLKKNS